MLSDWLPEAATRLGLQALRRAALPAVPVRLGAYHPLMAEPLQVAGTAAEHHRQSAQALWSAPAPAALILASDLPATPWLQLDELRNSTVYSSPDSAHATLWQLRADFARHGATSDTLHASLVEVFGLGVLLSGASGTGKSELALQLVARGHRLVSDDVVKVSRPAPGCLLGHSPTALQGFLEVRGLGILDLRAAYGVQCIAAAARLDLCLQLDPTDSVPAAEERLHGRRDQYRVLDVDVPRIVLPSRLRHNAVMVEAACRDHWLRRAGYTASQALVDAQTRLAAGPHL